MLLCRELWLRLCSVLAAFWELETSGGAGILKALSSTTGVTLKREIEFVSGISEDK